MDKCNCSMSIRMLGDGCRYCQPQEHIDRLGEWLEDERVERAKAEAEAGTLATAIWEQFYKESAPDWGLRDSVPGVISQIDNMFAGVRDQLAQAKATIEEQSSRIDLLRGCMKSAYGVLWVSHMPPEISGNHYTAAEGCSRARTTLLGGLTKMEQQSGICLARKALNQSKGE